MRLLIDGDMGGSGDFFADEDMYELGLGLVSLLQTNLLYEMTISVIWWDVSHQIIVVDNSLGYW